MSLEKTLFDLGVGTWQTDISTALGAVGQPSIKIGNTLPNDVGFIYGLATYADGVDAQNAALPSTVQCQALYLTLQSGSSQFIQEWRVSDLLNEFAGTPIVRVQKYTPVAIPWFDLSKSAILNPTLIVSVTVHLRLWYVQMDDWKRIENKFPFLLKRSS